MTSSNKGSKEVERFRETFCYDISYGLRKFYLILVLIKLYERQYKELISVLYHPNTH
jgi:hypothetical protein